MRWSVCLLCLFAAFIAKTAHGAPAAAVLGPSVGLTLSSSDKLPSCLSVDTLKADVRQRLGRDVFVSGDAEALFVIEVGLTFAPPSTWRVEIATTQTLESAGPPVTGRRTLRLRSSTCEDLLQPLSLVITLTIDPSAPVQQPLPRKDPPPDRIVTVVPIKIDQPAPIWTFSLGAGLGASWGAMPNTAAAGQLRLAAFRAGLPGGALTLSYQQTRDSFADSNVSARRAQATFASWAMGLEVLPPLWKHAYAVGAVQCGASTTQGSGFDQNLSSRQFGCASGGGLLQLLPVSARLGLFVRAGLDVPWQRRRFAFRTSDGLVAQGFRASLVTVSAAIGLTIGF